VQLATVKLHHIQIRALNPPPGIVQDIYKRKREEEGLKRQLEEVLI
jgi:hypothetical protein